MCIRDNRDSTQFRDKPQCLVLVPTTKPLLTKFRPWFLPAVCCLYLPSLCAWLSMRVWGNPMYLKPPFGFIFLHTQLSINASLMTPLGTARGPRHNEGLLGDPDKRLFLETRGASWEITHPKERIIAFLQGYCFWDSENLCTQSLGLMSESWMMELPERLEQPWKLQGVRKVLSSSSCGRAHCLTGPNSLLPELVSSAVWFCSSSY